MGPQFTIYQQEKMQTSLKQLSVPEVSGYMLGQWGKKEEGTSSHRDIDFRWIKELSRKKRG